MAGKLIIEQSNLTPKYNVLIITPAPTETSPQFTDDLFKKYNDFNKFEIIHLKSSNMIENLKLKDNNIIVVSKQLLQMFVNNYEQVEYEEKNGKKIIKSKKIINTTIKEIKNLKLNLIVFDENHFGGTTDRSEEILTSYLSPSTIKLYLTATYNKSLKKWKVPQDCQIFWDIEDEQFCKQKNINGLVEKHGDMVTKVLKNMEKEGFTQDEIMNEYQKYPDLHILTTMFDSQRWEIIKDSIMESKYGFSMDVLFSLAKGKKQFMYPNEIKKVLQFISGDKKEQNFKDKDLSMFKRIDTIRSQYNSRTPFTQLWFLPVNGINDISENLKKIMSDDGILKQYDVYIVNSKSNDEVDNVKGEINKREITARENKKRGLIILAGNMLTLGITLSLCDVVFLMNDTLSSDKVMQMMYRSMTESKKMDKKCGFVIDMKISRVLQACISYNIHKKIQNTEDKIKFLIENHLINIDDDYLVGKEIDSDKIINKLMGIWKSDPINNLNILLRQIEDDILEMDNDDQKSLNKYFAKSVNEDKFDVNVELNNEKQDIKSGKEIKKVDENDSKDANSDTESDDEKEDERISLTKDVLPFVIPFACALTLKDNNNDFVEMLNTISKDPELLEIFNEQSFIWWNNKDIIELIKKLTTKYIEKNSNTFNIAIIIKMTLKSLIDKPKELLEFISERLKPKLKEKKEFGEVFTPMELIGEKLDKLDDCYIKLYKTSIFSNKDLKWYDPACGMGNYPIAVFLRLMEGLKDVIKNKEKRKKHILENMLYMSELNKKNVSICKQIFDVNNEYKLNINQGDSLKIDIKKIWNIDEFDVVMGNPPYQLNDDDGKRKAKNHSLYVEFMNDGIKKLKKNGFLVFINPSSWLSLSGKNKEFELLCIENTMLYLNLEEAKKKYFSKIGSTFCWYIVQKNNIKGYKTEIDCYYKDEIFNSETNIKELTFIPLLITDEVVSIFKKTVLSDLKKFNVETNTSFHYGIKKNKEFMKIEKDNTYKYKIIHTPSQTLYSSKKHALQDTYKVFLPLTTYYEKMVVDKAGMTQGCYFIQCESKEKADDTKNILLCKLYRFINNICRWGNFNCPRIMEKLPFIKISNDEEIYKHFKLTKKEIELVEKIIKNDVRQVDDSDSDGDKKPKKIIKKKLSTDDKKPAKKKAVKKVESDTESESDSSDSEDEKYSKKKNVSKK
jgi:adenine-specific DNA-methyltransferase